MAGVGAAQSAGRHGVDDAGLANYRGDRCAAAQPLGQCDQIGLHAFMLNGKHPASASHAGLDFIGDHHDAVRIAQGAQLRQEARWRRQITAFALHRLHQQRGHAPGFDVVAEQPIQRLHGIVHGHTVQGAREGHVVNVCAEWPKAQFVGSDLAGQRHAQLGAAVERALEGDHRIATGRMARNFDRVLNGLSPGGHEQRLLGRCARCQAAQLLGQRHVGLIGHNLEAGVREQLVLRRDRAHHGRMAVAGVHDCDAGAEIDVAAAFHVPDLGIAGSGGKDAVCVAYGARHAVFAALHQGLVAGFSSGRDDCLHVHGWVLWVGAAAAAPGFEFTSSATVPAAPAWTRSSCPPRPACRCGFR